MAKASADLWLKQAESDFDSAGRVYDAAGRQTYCQAIAKYQQAVEKSIKGIVVALRSARKVSNGPWYSHDLEREIGILKNLPPLRIDANAVRQIKALTDAANRSDIQTLCSLAPERPEPGGLTRRNTEYPFQRPDETWIAPAEDDAFTQEETERFRLAASRNLEGARRIVSLLRGAKR